MKNILILFICFSIWSCSSNCGLELNIPTSVNNEVAMMNEAEILQYLSDNNLIANKTESGLYYIIDNAGGIEKPVLCDDVTVVYNGHLVNGNEFDSSDPAGLSFSLSSVILGWKEGIPLFGVGGKGTLLIPSKLGYSVSPPSSEIPINAVLIFEIELLKIN